MAKVIILILMCLFLLVFIFIEPILTKHKVKNDHEYGSARFATFKEIKRLFKCESVSNILKPGFPVYYSKDLNNIYFDRETPHYVYLGSTGSGKSVTAVIPTSAQRNGSHHPDASTAANVQPRESCTDLSPPEAPPDHHMRRV